MRRRLPLISSTAAPTTPSPSGRAAARRRAIAAIGIADTGSGAQARAFAEQLLAALVARGRQATGTFLAFGTPPAADPELARAFAQAGGALALRAIASDPEVTRDAELTLDAELKREAELTLDAQVELGAEPEADPPLNLAASARVPLWIGVPALACFAPTLSVLVGAERPLALWPPALRTYRAQYQLALAGDRPGIARALAELIAGGRVLPGG